MKHDKFSTSIVCIYVLHESSHLVFHNVFPSKWQDEYNPIDLFSHAPRSGQPSQTQCKPISNDGEDGEVEVLRMVAECFSKYDCLNFDGHKTEATIHDGLGMHWLKTLMGRRVPQWTTMKVAIRKRKK